MNYELVQILTEKMLKRKTPGGRTVSFFLLLNQYVNACKNKQESPNFYPAQKVKRVKILLSPTLPTHKNL